MNDPQRPLGPISETRRIMRDYTRDTGIPPRDSTPISPLFLERNAYFEIRRAALQILRLCKRAVLSCGSSTGERLEFYQVDPAEYPLFSGDAEFEEGLCDIFARPDFVLTDTGPKVLEYNVSGAVGGVAELSTLMAALEASYGRRCSVPWEWADPFADRAAAFENVADYYGLTKDVLVVGSSRDLKHASTPRILDLETDALRARGFRAEYVEPEGIEEAIRRGVPDLGLRMFTIPEWEELGIDFEPVRDLLVAGNWLLTPQTSAFLANKKTLGLLSEGLPWMSAEDRRLVAKYVPWTRVLGDRRSTSPSGRRIDLIDYVLSKREDVVLKQGIGMQGLQVTIGRLTTPGIWEEMITSSARDCSSIVQSYVEPTSQQVWMSHGESHAETELLRTKPILSFFLFGGRSGSGWARFRPDDTFGLVSREGFGAFETAIHPSI